MISAELDIRWMLEHAIKTAYLPMMSFNHIVLILSTLGLNNIPRATGICLCLKLACPKWFI